MTIDERIDEINAAHGGVDAIVARLPKAARIYVVNAVEQAEEERERREEQEASGA